MMDATHPTDCASCPIRDIALCAKCDDGELAKIARIKSTRRFEAGQTIAAQGEGIPLVSSIVDGVAAVSRTLEDGRTQLAGLLFAKDMVGAPGEGQAAYDIVAKTPVTLCCFERHAFEAHVEEMPHLASRLAELALDERDAARAYLFLLGRKTAREKIASFLLFLIERQRQMAGSEAPGIIRLPVSRDEIGSLLGLALETVSRHLNGLGRDGILQILDHRRLRILDRAALERSSGDAPAPMTPRELQVIPRKSA
ncbi:MAG: Crp/Fnr family transcriptional regulator [Pseudomonadota bacterium]